MLKALQVLSHCRKSKANVVLRTVALHLQPTCLGLSGGRGFAKARTGGELPKSCEVSHETAPRLTPNPLLWAVCFWNILPFFIRTNCQSTTNYKCIDFMRIVKIAEHFFCKNRINSKHTWLLSTEIIATLSSFTKLSNCQNRRSSKLTRFLSAKGISTLSNFTKIYNCHNRRSFNPACFLSAEAITTLSSFTKISNYQNSRSFNPACFCPPK